MFFLIPGARIFVIYIAAAIIPALFLMRRIYVLDSIESEPSGLLANLVLQGVFAALASILFEFIGETVLDFSGIDPYSPVYTIVLAFLIVAVVEEGMKFLFLYHRTWRDSNFDFRFDGIVYSAFVSLGFAAFENIIYVFRYGLSVAGPRAVLSIPGHLGFSVVFGYFYGRAKMAENRGNASGKTGNLIAGYVLAVFLHGFYDTCTMLGTDLSMLIFLAFVIIMYIVIIRLVKHEAATDEPV